jgi:chromosome segregation ATPase
MRYAVCNIIPSVKIAVCLQNLAREKELLTTKLQNILEGDTASFGLQLYTTNEEISLSNPTKTMNLVLGLVETNSRLQAEMDTLKAHLDAKARQGETHQQQLQELQESLLVAERNNQFLSAELHSTRQASGAAEAERQQLRRQVGELTYSTVHLTQENKLLKERMRLYQY